MQSADHHAIRVERQGQKPMPMFLELGTTYIGWTHHTSNLLHRVQIGAKTTMHGKNFLVNNGCDGQAVEAISESLPKLDIIPSLALIVETVDTVDRSTLMIPSQYEEVLWVLDFVGE